MYKLGRLLVLWTLIMCVLVCRTAYKDILWVRQSGPNWVNNSLQGYLPRPDTMFLLLGPIATKMVVVNPFGFFMVKRR